MRLHLYRKWPLRPSSVQIAPAEAQADPLDGPLIAPAEAQADADFADAPAEPLEGALDRRLRHRTAHQITGGGTGRPITFAGGAIGRSLGRLVMSAGTSLACRGTGRALGRPIASGGTG